MEDWFTVEKIDCDTFAISEYKHWEETHSYLLCGTDQAVLIDTGLGVGNIKDIVQELTRLPVQVITTHAHWDHIGGHHLFDKIAVHEAEIKWLSEEFPIPLAVVKSNLMKEPCDFSKDFDIDKYHVYQGTPNLGLQDGDCINLGNRKLSVIHTPGHSPGHCCFYEPDKKYLYSGDLIYKGCLDAFYPTTDPKLFMQSVQVVQLLPINKILPAHHALDIPVDIINKIVMGFEELSNGGKLQQGNGLFDFGDFQIHI